ncbi:MAG TPA: patatin-like phospholipase family protein [Gemmatimonadota bacterium]|nr:patatin-like phospholipase family protein [Gemmatimonadota bacterium]
MSRRANETAPNHTALVLSGGGARGAYQVGVLRYIAERRPFARFPILTGVSAGAINASFLAGHPDAFGGAVDALCERWLSLSTARVFRTDMPSLAGNAIKVLLNLGSGGSPLAPGVQGLVETAPLRHFLDGLIDPDAIAANIDAGRLRALAISATAYDTGRTVTYVQGEPWLETWERTRRRAVHDRITLDHVMASAAIPLFFPAVQVNGRYYGDGSLRQSHPLSPAIHLGADRILAISSRWRAPVVEPPTEGEAIYPPAAQVLGLLFNSIFLDNLDVDAERLRRVNDLLRRVPDSRRWLLSERPVRLLVLRPSSDIGRVARQYESSIPRSLRYLLRGLGTRKVSSSDLVSYLMFESEYLEHLIRLGERDAERGWFKIRRFLDADEATDAGAVTDADKATDGDIPTQDEG